VSTSQPPDQSNSPGLFDPPDVAWTPVSRKLAYVRQTGLALSGLPFVVAAAILAAVFTIPLLYGAAALFLAAANWLAVIIVRQVRATGYAERTDDLLVRHGILFRRMAVVPYGRMQYVDVTVGPLDRAFSIASVELHTAASSVTAKIDGLVPDQAARLRDRLAARGEANLAGL
jgi:membrane protein YdbS with pleckstrin-like domain